MCGRHAILLDIATYHTESLLTCPPVATFWLTMCYHNPINYNRCGGPFRTGLHLRVKNWSLPELPGRIYIAKHFLSIAPMLSLQ
jgi:hypothetical protein